MQEDLFTVAVDLAHEDETVVAVFEHTPEGPRLVSFEVELPHPDAVLLAVRPHYDGTVAVTLHDRLGVGHEATVTEWGPDALSASRTAAPRMMKSIEARLEQSAAREAARAASGRNPAPEGRVARNPLDAATRARRVGGAESQTVTGAYTGSVPRNALEWDVSGRQVRVRLKTGLVWHDTQTDEERTFPTIRLAKDYTRGASSG